MTELASTTPGSVDSYNPVVRNDGFVGDDGIFYDFQVDDDGSIIAMVPDENSRPVPTQLETQPISIGGAEVNLPVAYVQQSGEVQPIAAMRVDAEGMLLFQNARGDWDVVGKVSTILPPEQVELLPVGVVLQPTLVNDPETGESNFMLVIKPPVPQDASAEPQTVTSPDGEELTLRSSYGVLLDYPSEQNPVDNTLHFSGSQNSTVSEGLIDDESSYSFPLMNSGQFFPEYIVIDVGGQNHMYAVVPGEAGQEAIYLGETSLAAGTYTNSQGTGTVAILSDLDYNPETVEKWGGEWTFRTKDNEETIGAEGYYYGSTTSLGYEHTLNHNGPDYQAPPQDGLTKSLVEITQLLSPAGQPLVYYFDLGKRDDKLILPGSEEDWEGPVSDPTNPLDPSQTLEGIWFKHKETGTLVSAKGVNGENEGAIFHPISEDGSIQDDYFAVRKNTNGHDTYSGYAQFTNANGEPENMSDIQDRTSNDGDNRFYATSQSSVTNYQNYSPRLTGTGTDEVFIGQLYKVLDNNLPLPLVYDFKMEAGDTLNLPGPKEDWSQVRGPAAPDGTPLTGDWMMNKITGTLVKLYEGVNVSYHPVGSDADAAIFSEALPEGVTPENAEPEPVDFGIIGHDAQKKWNGTYTFFNHEGKVDNTSGRSAARDRVELGYEQSTAYVGYGTVHDTGKGRDYFFVTQLVGPDGKKLMYNIDGGNGKDRLYLPGEKKDWAERDVKHDEGGSYYMEDGKRIAITDPNGGAVPEGEWMVHKETGTLVRKKGINEVHYRPIVAPGADPEAKENTTERKPAETVVDPDTSKEVDPETREPVKGAADTTAVDDSEYNYNAAPAVQPNNTEIDKAALDALTKLTGEIPMDKPAIDTLSGLTFERTVESWLHTLEAHHWDTLVDVYTKQLETMLAEGQIPEGSLQQTFMEDKIAWARENAEVIRADPTISTLKRGSSKYAEAIRSFYAMQANFAVAADASESPIGDGDDNTYRSRLQSDILDWQGRQAEMNEDAKNSQNSLQNFG